jgi:glucose/mannose-6-phosphate isomerase
VDSKTLVVTTSISGNTIETLTVLESANKLGCKILAFSSGGKMEKICIEKNIKFIKISQIHSPRASFTSFLFAMLKTLEIIIPIQKKDINESLQEMKKIGEQISSVNLTNTNVSLKLAKWITNFPIIYYPYGLQAAAIRFKNCLQENSKLHALTEDVIEASHNGIVAWETTSIFQPIIIRGKDDYFKTKERWNIFEDYFGTRNIEYFEIYSKEGNILSKLVNLIYILDFASIYLAVIKKIDPSPVEPIDYIKKKL